MELNSDRIAKRIEQYRTALVTLTLTDAAGKPLANQPVTVRQTRHKFLFGCNAFNIGRFGDPALDKGYGERFAALLNYATLPFYWGGYEPAEGKPNAKGLRDMAEWCAQRGIRTKGHPLTWHTVEPKWLWGKPTGEVEKLQLARITREVKGFAGLIDVWDVVNESIVMPTYDKDNPISKLCAERGRTALIAETFAAARAANPKATLVLNDYMTGDDFADAIRACLWEKVAIDVIGIQSHMHKGYWGATKTWEVLERFAKLGKPLHFTELTILSGPLKTDDDWHGDHPGWDTTKEGEATQAQQAAEFYTILFSHPSVEAITWWDFSDLHAWQGAPSGLVRKDMTAKPAYDALMKLIKHDWWTGELKLTTDAKGQVTFRGFLGDYEAESPAGKAKFALEKSGTAAQTVRVAN
jgi:GH35 family endo-1,4-beta-xylanase